MTILSYLAIFAGLGLANTERNYTDAASLVFGVFLRSSFWWLVLSKGVTLFRKKVTPKAMTWVNRFARCISFGFGGFASISLFH